MSLINLNLAKPITKHSFYIITIFFVTTLLGSCFNPTPPDCKKFRTGDFYMRSAHKITYILKRSDSLQIEINKGTGGISKWEIKWQNDCEYNLKYIEDSTYSPNEKPLEFQNINFKIINSTDDYYIFSCKMPTILFTDTVWVMHDR